MIGPRRPIPNPSRKRSNTTTPLSPFPTLATAASRLQPTPLHQQQRRRTPSAALPPHQAQQRHDDEHHMPSEPASAASEAASYASLSDPSRSRRSHPVALPIRLAAAAHPLRAAFRGARGRLTERRQAFYAVLESRVFPGVVSYATHPVTILLTILLLIPLIALASVTAISLTLGNYTNVVSAAVSSIVLAKQLQHHAEVKALHAEHSARISAIEQRMTSRRTTASKVAAEDDANG